MKNPFWYRFRFRPKQKIISAETESLFRFQYRFRPKTEMAVSACFGFGRNEKKPFGRTLKVERKRKDSEKP